MKEKEIVAVGILVNATKGFEQEDLMLLMETINELQTHRYLLYSTQDTRGYNDQWQTINGAINESYISIQEDIIKLSQKICRLEITLVDQDGDHLIRDNLYLRVVPGYTVKNTRTFRKLINDRELVLV